MWSLPLHANSQLKKLMLTRFAQSKYAQIIESLLHLMNLTRHDVAYVECRLSRLPQERAWVCIY